jgi:PAS domain S-box-containing protein
VNPTPAWLEAPGWRDFFDLLSDAVVVFDAASRVVLANTAALRLAPCEAGMSLDQLQGALGAAAVGWLKRVGAGLAGSSAAPTVRLADGRTLTLAWRRLDPKHGALHLSPNEPAEPGRALAPPPDSAPFAAPAALAASAMREAIDIIWEAPFPALLQDRRFRIIDANPAFLDFTGYAREQLVGRDAKELAPEEDWPVVVARREALRAPPGRTGRIDERALTEGRLLDSSGRERRYRVTRRTLVNDHGEFVYLAVLQDSTAEHVARCARSTTGSTSARSAWCCSTSTACCCTRIRRSTPSWTACRCRWPMHRPGCANCSGSPRPATSRPPRPARRRCTAKAGSRWPAKRRGRCARPCAATARRAASAASWRWCRTAALRKSATLRSRRSAH